MDAMIMAIQPRGGAMKRQCMKKWLRVSFFGLMCLLLFLGTKNEGCSSCSMIDEQLETEYGTIKIVNFLDLIDYDTVYINGSHANSVDNGYPKDMYFTHTWDSIRDNQVVQKKVKAGPYNYDWWGLSQNKNRYRYVHGSLVVKAGGTITLTIK